MFSTIINFIKKFNLHNNKFYSFYKFKGILFSKQFLMFLKIKTNERTHFFLYNICFIKTNEHTFFIIYMFLKIKTNERTHFFLYILYIRKNERTSKNVGPHYHILYIMYIIIL